METLAKSTYLTATSLTARQINRRIILNIIYRYQPISRADTARETGLQRSTVSLIVDELINDGWVVEGEHGRIPRGRRPIYLHINTTGAGLLGLHISSSGITYGLADLSGNVQWVRQENSAISLADLRNALQDMRALPEFSKQFQLKGIGVALDNAVLDSSEVHAVIKEVFQTEVTVESSAVACGKWFLLCHKDAPLAREHLVSIDMSGGTSLGVIVAGHPLRGAHGHAGAVLNNIESGQAGRTNGHHSSLDKVGHRLEFAIQAYDPGVILVTGQTSGTPESTEQELAQRLTSAGAAGATVRVIPVGDNKDNVYIKGAVAAILNHFLEECPTG